LAADVPHACPDGPNHLRRQTPRVALFAFKSVAPTRYRQGFGSHIDSVLHGGNFNFDPKERDTRLKRWQTQLHPVHGATASDLFAEAERHAKAWDYVQWANALRTRPVLLVEADDQNHTDMEALASALRQKLAARLQQKVVATDHGFSGHRIALKTIVINWLQQ
jgi:hypothetical protein